MVTVVNLYRAPTTVADTTEIANWLRNRIDADIEIKEPFLELYRDAALPEAFARARVLSPYDSETGNEMLGVIRYEERVLDNPERGGGVIYDGFDIRESLERRLPATERSLDILHVVLLDRIIGTWGNDGRWHKRVNVLGPLSLLSVPGLYEALAKPESYYRAKQKHALVSGDSPPREVLENEVDGQFLRQDDPRTTAALKGYVLQAVHLLRTGDAFCDRSHCRLYNAHRQETVIEAQLQPPEFCEEHAVLYG